MHEHGIEIKDQDLYKKGVPLQDVLRSDLIDNDNITSLDRMQALAEADKYLKHIHDNYGGVGEMNIGDIIFKQHDNGLVSGPVLNMPDIVFNEEKNIGDKEKKATDILDFIISVGAEEFRSSGGDVEKIKESIRTVLNNYENKEVVSLVKSYIKRGRLTLLGDANSSAVNISEDSFTTKHRAIFTKHNEARIVNNKDLETLLKDIGLEICEEIIAK